MIAPRAPSSEQRRLDAIIDYYDRATLDYAHWNATLHMHLGCWRWPISPLDRAAMVEQLSADVIDRLALASPGTVVDLGCGVGSSARLLARRSPSIQVIGLSLSAAQIDLGNRLTRQAKLHERVELRVADYRETELANASMIGAYAIESACYDLEHGGGLIREAARILGPGARLVVADAFRRRRLPRLARALERKMSVGWALPGLSEIDRFCARLREHGFAIEAVEDISWRVAPSLVQIPWVALRFRLRAGLDLGPRRDANVHASWWCLLCALLFPRRFGYFMITATRR